MRYTYWPMLLPFAAFSVVVAAQQPPTPPRPDAQSPAVTFRVEVNYVEIDANVTDAQGNFVRNLTKDDFQIIEDGKPQTLTVFSMVDIPIERVDPPLFAKNAILPDVVPTAAVRGARVRPGPRRPEHAVPRERAHARRGAAVRRALRRRQRHRRRRQHVRLRQGACRTSRATGARAEGDRRVDGATRRTRRPRRRCRTTTRTATRRARASNANATFNELLRYNNARNTLRTLKNIADYMAGMRGRRKAVVFFSEGINYNITDPINNPHATDVQHEIRDLVAAATRANVNVYSVDPRGVTSRAWRTRSRSAVFPADGSISATNLMDEMRLEHDSLRVVADETGGFAVLNQNDFRNAFSRILEDNSSYYVLGYYPTNDKRDGRFSNVQVKVLKPGLKVRSRQGYVAPVPPKKEKPPRDRRRSGPRPRCATRSTARSRSAA